ncbi:DUF3102 domain-containing protein [Bradyrhizobium valentinum]|uniref:DUF3102 domain-containing protein n=1 Tax=Bradyrhizobium valentinum TaxID=1518501 RepID=A0A0R3L8J1_9BRAD|nr:DUF3102 domain-containing protein [Bradyrhizobium valentinum]KRR04226.1 hypothetical protein CP49_23680 [Bradyrhizobium valentinum]
MTISAETTNVVALYPPRKDVEEAPLDEFLDELAERVRDHCRSTTASIIAIGRALVQAKDHVEHGQFKQWVTSQCGFTIRTAQNYMRAYALASQAGEIISLLNPAALYRLSAPKTPPGAITRVVEMLHRGFIPTEAEIIVLIMCLSLAHDDPEAHEEGVDEQTTLELARELHSRLGEELVSKLIGSRWSDLRKHLRNALEQSSRAAKPRGSQLRTEAISG